MKLWVFKEKMYFLITLLLPYISGEIPEIWNKIPVENSRINFCSNLTKLISNQPNNVLVNYYKEINLDLVQTALIHINPFLDIQLLDQTTNINTFIILLTEMNDLRHFLTLLNLKFYKNVRANFILVDLNLNLNLSEIFQHTWTYYIQNIIVVKSQEMFTHFPYGDGRCGDNFVGVKVRGDELFPKKVPTVLPNCKMRLMALHLKPYVLNLTADKEDPKLSGVEVTIIHNVLKKMGLGQEYLDNTYVHWGYLNPDGNFTMFFQELHSRRADIVFGMMIGNETIEPHFDGSVYSIDTTAVWFVPAALPIAQWKNLTVIFDGIVWTSIFFVFTLNGIVWWILGRNKEPTGSYNELSLCLMGAFYILLQGSFTTPKGWKLRFIVLIWSLSSLLIFTAHQCQLTGILTSPLYEHQISNLKELVDSNLDYGFYPVLKDLYRDPKNPVRWTILNQFKPCTLGQSCMNRTAFNRDFAVIKNRRQGAFFMPKYYTAPTGKPMLYMFKESEFVVWCKYFVQKGFPFLDRMNHVILLLQSNGLIQKWDADIVEGRKGDDDITKLEALTLNHLQGAFFLLIIGYLIASVTVVMEKIYYRFWQTKNVEKTIEIE